MAKEYDLRSILDRNIDEHKAEMRQMAASTLISPKLHLSTDSVPKWRSANKTSTHKKLRPNKALNQRSTVNEGANVSDSMFLFSLGPHEVVDKLESARPLKKPIKLKSLDVKCRVNDLRYDRCVAADECVPVADDRSDSPIVTRSVDKFEFASPRYPSRDRLAQCDAARSDRINILPHYIHPRYRTRYDEMIRFRNDNVRESDQVETDLVQGSNLVRHLEDRLMTGLEQMGKLGRTPNFQRLRIYSSIFEDLISESWMFKSVLSQIKKSYDAEVDRVLQMPISEKELLDSEMDQLKRSIYQKEKLENIQSEISQLKDAIKTANETETGYQLLLIEEEKKMEDLIKTKSQIDDERRKAFVPETINVLPTETEKLELLKTQCWEKMDDISKMQKETKYSMTSRATITHLTEGLQDVSIEVEKLNHQKTQLESEVDKMKTELLNYLGNSDIAEKDYKLINSLLEGSTALLCDLYDESNRWSWYIS